MFLNWCTSHKHSAEAKNCSAAEAYRRFEDWPKRLDERHQKFKRYGYWGRNDLVIFWHIFDYPKWWTRWSVPTQLLLLKFSSWRWFPAADDLSAGRTSIPPPQQERRGWRTGTWPKLGEKRIKSTLWTPVLARYMSDILDKFCLQYSNSDMIYIYIYMQINRHINTSCVPSYTCAMVKSLTTYPHYDS